MSTCNASKKVLKASGNASARNVQHILVVLKPDGTLALSGSDNIVHAIIADVELYNKFQTIVNSSRRQEGSKVDHVEVLTYPMLPCSPYSSKFKGSHDQEGVGQHGWAGGGSSWLARVCV